ncbi:MAG TPA: LOG family protein [Acidimicrobiia bacterium]|nr:LOG family protein [Acidimicrobiia bacterium]
MRTVIAVFGASASEPGDGLYEQAMACGRQLADAGYAVATGGYGGVMEAVSRGAHEANGRVIGVTAPGTFPDRSGANEFVTEESQAAHLVERIHELTDVSSGSITLPGSLGTLAELAIAWNLAYVARFSGSLPKPVVVVGERWQEIIDFLGEHLGADTDLITTVPHVEAAVEAIRRRVPPG